MSDFIKEFNMTDFLGMLFPGSALFVLFAKEMNIWPLLQMIWGREFGLATRVSVVIIFGYVIGMLIHEIGDIIEKMMWMNPILNPRTHAAFVVGLINMQFNTEKAHGDSSGSIAKAFCSIVCSIPVVCSISIVLVGDINKRFAIVIVAFLIVLVILRYKYLNVLGIIYKAYGTSSGKRGALGAAIEEILRGDAKLMCYNTKMPEEEKKEKMRKRNLFDGFRTMARNLFIVLVILSTYGMLTNGFLSCMCRTVYSDPVYRSIVIGLTIVLVLRYWRYSYLRFKYSYEDYLLYAKEKEEKEAWKCPCCRNNT